MCFLSKPPYHLYLAPPREPQRHPTLRLLMRAPAYLIRGCGYPIANMLPAAAPSTLLCVFSTVTRASFDAFQATFDEGHPNSFNSNESRLCLGVEVQAARLQKLRCIIRMISGWAFFLRRRITLSSVLHFLSEDSAASTALLKARLTEAMTAKPLSSG